MIHYTLKGPIHNLEIHDDKLIVLRKGFLKAFARKQQKNTWEIHRLSQFNITVPQYLFWGKVEWKDFDGVEGSFRFSTHPLMMQKIELYLQKKIIKNHQAILEAQKTNLEAQRANLEAQKASRIQAKKERQQHKRKKSA